ncbi:hypothetical protein BJX68DRAFT_277965 [Aspergillus pseudodeflectus]|uniref:FAD-binding PCMH-type domain-containing protein n=1 Tax=Aspergillus pseudodeflectus TaxID=176178 RepID=A0ABR4JUZ2_9EURO
MRFVFAFIPGVLPLLLLANPALTLKTDPSSNCAIISVLLLGKVAFPGSESYNVSETSYFALQGRLSPACIAMPSSAEDVATIVGTLAKLPDAVFAIRSGGHSPNPGWANAAQGITSDLQQLNKVHVSSDGSIAAVGPGARWVDVHRVLDPLELDVVGGKFGSVGVAGLILGGISAFSPSRGWACDNVANFQIVLASGETVIANDSNEYADLFIALKGGQNNFGVVTRFDLRTFRHGLYWGGNIAYPDSTEQAQLAAYITFKGPSYDSIAEIEQSFMYASSPNGSASRSCLNTMFYADPVVDPSGLRPFSDIQPQLFSTMRIATATAFAEELNPGQLARSTYVIHTSVTFRFTPEIIPRVFAIWKVFCRRIELTGMANLIFFGLPPDSHPDRELSLALFSLHWLDAGYADMITVEARTLIRDIEDLVADARLAHPFLYANWAAWWQDPIRGYGKESVRHLQRMSGKYDPDRVFQEKVPGRFKLPRDEF